MDNRESFGTLHRRSSARKLLTDEGAEDAEPPEFLCGDVLQEMNDRTTADRTLVDGFRSLAADGSTSCWIYPGVYPATDRNRARDRNAIGPYGHGWGFAWPAEANRGSTICPCLPRCRPT